MGGVGDRLAVAGVGSVDGTAVYADAGKFFWRSVVGKESWAAMGCLR